ncbi:exonuclease SbcCD subunit D, partial [Streptomyces sp. NPDC087425]|uniref:metallophosphoesterase family protein n=1 Tax=Streptomyces sp. NPDC087425 TaxID=3365787 RepID=UPI0038232C4E
MRFLHTSDWHIGRTFHGADLLAEQEAVLGHLADLVAGEAIDAVLVAGDIYDRAVPSAEAVRVATVAVARIRAAGARLIVTPGNHDSAPRLGAF